VTATSVVTEYSTGKYPDWESANTFLPPLRTVIPLNEQLPRIRPPSKTMVHAYFDHFGGS